MSFQDFETDEQRLLIERYSMYEEYLDNFITEDDRRFLQYTHLARQLIEAGINPKTSMLSKQEFYLRKENEEKKKTTLSKRINKIAFSQLPRETIDSDPFFRALAEREEPLMNEKKAVILFIRAVVKQPSGKEVETSGYIDLADRVKKEDFVEYYRGSKLLLPKPSDLSYFNWTTGKVFYNESVNFKNDPNFDRQILTFVNKKDKKAMVLDPEKVTKEGIGPIVVHAKIPEYKQVLIFESAFHKK